MLQLPKNRGGLRYCWCAFSVAMQSNKTDLYLDAAPLVFLIALSQLCVPVC